MGFWPGHRGWWGRQGRTFGRHGVRRSRRGILKFLLLKLLAELPRHGYELIRAVREKGWGGGPGSVYPLLAALEAAGLIVGRDEGERRVYEISEKGRRLLEEHAGDLGRFFEGDHADEPSQEYGDRLRDSAGRLMQAIAQLGAFVEA
jgi:DNA-binding PadR family transcriptional regulator